MTLRNLLHRLPGWLPALVVIIGLGQATLAQVPARPTAPFNGLPPQPPRTAYRFADALPGVTFSQPLAIASPPGETNRLFVVEKTGNIIVITNLARPTRTVFLNLSTNLRTASEQGVLGLAFHPRYAENGRLFVYRSMATGHTATRTDHDVVSEFRVSATDRNRGDHGSELRLFAQRDEANNHNGGDLHFGPDGYLYIAVGDEGGANDSYNNGQRIDRDLFAGLLRIDVDRRPGSLPPNRDTNNAANAWMITTNYTIPADNPFIGATTFNGLPITASRVRTEFFVTGLRNPWRFSFDRATGDLWIADVGQDRWEMIFVSRRGANHGWPFREGNIPGPRSGMPTGFLTQPSFNYVAPVHVYAHGSGVDRGNSITGGHVYRGSRISALHGAYIYGDYVSGNIWALRRNPGTAPTVERLTGLAGVAGFGIDPSNGDILAAQLSNGRVMRLEAGSVVSGTPFPPTLADTGAFTDTPAMQVSPAFTAYDVNLPFWSDHAHKSRWFHLPTNTFAGFRQDGAWTTPAGTVWMKHFELELTNGVPESRRRLETRFLVRMTNGVYGVTYRWNSSTNAVLVPDAGAEETLSIRDGDQIREQVWRYPSRTECLICHNAPAGGSLSFHTRQLNLPATYPGDVRTNQIGALIAAGYLTNAPAGLHALPTFAAPAPAPGSPTIAESTEWKVRRYLDVNCAFCHQPGGLGGGLWDARTTTSTDLAGLIRGTLVAPHGGPDARVIVPGNPAASALLDRMARRDARRMPPVGSNEVDEAGAALLTSWIHSLTNQPTFPQWLESHLGANTPASPDRTTDTDLDGDPDYLEFLTGTDPTRADSRWRPGVSLDTEAPLLRWTVPANTASRVEAMDTLTGTWETLDVPANQPVFRAETSEQSLVLPTEGNTGFYRIQLWRP